MGFWDLPSIGKQCQINVLKINFLFLVLSRTVTVVSLTLTLSCSAFQIVCLVEDGGGGGGGYSQACIPKIKLTINQFEMQFSISYRHRTKPDAKFEFGTSSIFGDMTHKLSFSKREQVIELGYLPSGNGFNSPFQQFPSKRKCLRFQNFLDVS